MRPKKAKRKSTAKASARQRRDPNRYPKGWDAQSIQSLIDHYEQQSEDEAVAEDEAAYRSVLVTMMAIPVELVPQVQKLLAKRAG